MLDKTLIMLKLEIVINDIGKYVSFERLESYKIF